MKRSRWWPPPALATLLLRRRHARLVAEQRPFLALPAVGEEADAELAALGVVADLQAAALLDAIDRGRVGEAGDLAAQGHVDRRGDLAALGVERLQAVEAGHQVVVRLAVAGGREAKDRGVGILGAAPDRLPSAFFDMGGHALAEIGVGHHIAAR